MDRGEVVKYSQHHWTRYSQLAYTLVALAAFVPIIRTPKSRIFCGWQNILVRTTTPVRHISGIALEYPLTLLI